MAKKKRRGGARQKYPEPLTEVIYVRATRSMVEEIEGFGDTMVGSEGWARGSMADLVRMLIRHGLDTFPSQK